MPESGSDVVRSGDRWTRASSLPGATSSDIAVAAAGDDLIAGRQLGTTVKVATLR